MPTQALHRAAQLMEAAAVLSAETIDANPKVCNALNQAICLLTEISQSLVERSLPEIQPVPPAAGK